MGRWWVCLVPASKHLEVTYLLAENRAFAEKRSRRARLFLPDARLSFFLILAINGAITVLMLIGLQGFLQTHQLERRGVASQGRVVAVNSYHTKAGTRLEVTYAYSTALGERISRDRPIDEVRGASLQIGQKVPVVYLEEIPSVARLGTRRDIWVRAHSLSTPLLWFLLAAVGALMAWITWRAGRDLMIEQSLQAGKLITGRVLDTSTRSGRYKSQHLTVHYAFELEGETVEGVASFEAAPDRVEIPGRGDELTLLVRDRQLHRPL